MTWEQSLKRALTIGRHLVLLKKGDQTRKVLVQIGARGRVLLLPMPEQGDMYTSWVRVRDDHMGHEKGLGTVVWAALSPEFMEQFNAAPSAVIEVQAATSEDPSGSASHLPIDTNGAGA